jgi:UMP-CMP kinase
MAELEQTNRPDPPITLSTNEQAKMTQRMIGLTRKPTVISVLGGPGSGKGTQCGRIAREHGVAHLSVRDVLRAEIARPDSPYAAIIEDNIRNGRVGPKEITVELLGNSIREIMENTAIDVFLLDG